MNTPEQLAARVRALRVDPECDPQHALWYCKIGETAREMLPPGSDGPMRDAIEAAYKQLTGHESDYIFSGWAATLTEPELAVVENRFPVYEKTDWATLTEAADLIESQAQRIRELEGVLRKMNEDGYCKICGETLDGYKHQRELEGAAITDAALDEASWEYFKPMMTQGSFNWGDEIEDAFQDGARWAITRLRSESHQASEGEGKDG